MPHSTLIVLSLTLLVKLVAGQGLRPSGATPVGASGNQLQQLYKYSQHWKASYRLRPKSACSARNTANLCGAAATNIADTYAQLTLATSPEVYSSLDSRYTNGVHLVAPPGNQQSCQTCSAFAVASVAETAMASALNVSAADCSISVQALYFCQQGKLARACMAGWELQEALKELVDRGQQLPTAQCQPYEPDFTGVSSYSSLCNPVCSTTSRYATQGQYSSTQIVDIWEAQRHIREYGSVVTGFDVYSDFKAFFENKTNAKAVYSPGPGATFEFGHAVALVGYDNVNNFWVAKNSWGATWGDDGYFRVSYGVCSVLTPGAEAAWGVFWTPNDPPVSSKLKVLPGPRVGSTSCYWYMAQPGDYLSKVAWRARIPLDRFMVDNTDAVKDLDAPLAGIKLVLCKPDPGTILTPGAAKSGSDTQLAALLMIKASIDTTNMLQGWTKESGADAGYCYWRAITCAEDNVSVRQIDIWNGQSIKGLRGSLPSGAVFSGLPRLDSLTISNQPNITGTIPDWSNLTNLNELYLFKNGLTGPIPTSLSKLTRLKTLYLYSNTLQGTMPGDLQALTALEQLDLGVNSLVGTLPSWLGTLTRLTDLEVNNNKFSGTVPGSLAHLSSLRKLWLNDNPALQGCVPQPLKEQLSMSAADVKSKFEDGTQISGFCSDDGVSASSAPPQALNMSETSDAQLEALLGIRKALDPTGVLAGWNRAAGEHGGYCDWIGVDCLSGTKTIWRLNMWYRTGVDGLQSTLPSAAEFHGLPNLTSISITSQPGLRGILPEDWSTMTQLNIIAVSNNSLSGIIPSSYASLARLSEFYAWGNGLSGPLPGSLSRLKALTALDVSTNRLSGSIPAWLGELKYLRTLSLDENSFKGHIPDTLGQLRNLETLELYSNELSGPLPASFGSLSKLKVLYLCNNSLTGTLPSSLGQQTQLEALSICKNGFFGTIPASYSNMTSLRTFWSWGNPMLQGCMPLRWSNQLNITDVKNNVLDKTQLKGFC